MTQRGIWILLACALTLACGSKSSDDNNSSPPPIGATGGTGAVPPTGCALGQVFCAGQCVDPLSNAANCGACGVSCGSGSCAVGQCQCLPGQATCSGSCVDLQIDSANCGVCGVACPLGNTCVAGSCTFTGCPAGTIQCGAECADTTSSSTHCGACYSPCAAGRACVAGSCQCAAPTVDCGGLCTDTTTNSLHCGACNQPCPSGTTCSAGSCVCPLGREACNGSCLDLSADPTNCGACGVACSAEQTCVAGNCVCPEGTSDCGDAGCVDLQGSNENCGLCGLACAGGKHCSGGSCQCEEGLDDCGGLCVDTQTSHEHCGACDAGCPDDRSCLEGSCSGIVGDGPDDCGGVAHSITIEKVSVYQAVEIPVMEEGSAVGAEARRADVVQGRDAMFRVHLRLESGWVPREISARVILETGDGEQILYAKLTPTQDSTQGDLASTARIDVDAELIGPETRYAVQLAECTAGTTGTIARGRFPEEGTVELGARATGPMEVVFVPITVGSWVPDTSDNTIELYREYLDAIYPTTEVRTSLAEGFSISSDFDWSLLLDELRDRRSREGLQDEVYYYGLLRPGETLRDYCQWSCTTGIGYVTDLGGWSSGLRVACGVGFGDETSAETLAHELGHNHGRDHTPCNVSGDPSYPYADGLLGSWGYDRRSGNLLDPERTADIMSYCSPVWVSDFTYRAYADRIAALNNEERSMVTAEGAAVAWRVLIVDGTGARWGIPYRKPLPPTGRAVAAEALAANGDVLATTVVYATPFVPGGTTYLVPPPQGGWHSIQIQGQSAVTYP